MKRLLPFVVLLLLLIGLVVGVSMLLHPDGHRAALSDYLSRRLGHPVRIGQLDAGLFPPTLRLNDVIFFQKPDQPFLQVEQIQAVLDWGSLLRARTVPSRLIFNRWKLSTRRHSDGSWDWNEWLGLSSKGSVLDAWPLREITLRQGEWHWVDDTVLRELVLKDVEASFDRDHQAVVINGGIAGATPITFTFEGKGPFLASHPWSGDIRLADEGRQWIVHLEGQQGMVDARGQSSEWRLDHAYNLAAFYMRWPGNSVESADRAVLHDWKSHFTWTASSMTFFHSATLNGGLMEVQGDVIPGPPEPILELKGAAQDVPLDALASVTGGLNLDGKVTGIVTDFSLGLSSHSWDSFNGRGSVEIKEGHIRFPASTVKNLARAHTMAYMRKKYPDFETQGLHFVRSGAHWQATHGLVTVLDGFLTGTDLKVGLTGKLDALRRGIDTYARIQLQEKSPALLKLISGKYVFGKPGHEQVQPIYGRVQGAWSEWTLRATPASKMTPTVKAQLRSALR